MSAFTENDLRHSASFLHKLNSIDDKISNLVSNIEVGVRNLWAKKYMMDWNDTYAGCATKGSDEYGEYIAVHETNLYENIGGGGNYNDILQGKVQFEEGKQYCLKVKWRTGISGTWGGLRLGFKYSDGIDSAYSVNTTSTSIETKEIISTKGKNIVGVYCTYGEMRQTRIYEIQLVQATKQPNDWLVAPEDLIDYTDTSIDNIKIGGRNLLARTHQYANTASNITSAYNTNDEIPIAARGNLTYVDFAYVTPIIPNGTEYILTFEAKSNKANAKINSHWYNPNTTTSVQGSQGQSGSAVDGSCLFTLTTEWKKYWVKWKQSETTAAKNCIVARNLISQNGTDCVVYVRNVKLEQGNKATDWTPAPEDIDAAIDAKLDKITGTNLNILYIGTDGVTSSPNLKYNASTNTLSTPKINVGGGALFTYNSTTGCLEISV